MLCDVSTWNANVFFELGIRVALDRPVAMVRDNLTSTIPFDNSIINTHTYDPSLQIDVVEEQVPALADFIKAAANQEQNALWKYFGITKRAKEPDSGSPESAKLELMALQLEGLRSEVSKLGKSPVRRPARQPPSDNAFGLAIPANVRLAEVGSSYRDIDLSKLLEKVGSASFE